MTVKKAEREVFRYLAEKLTDWRAQDVAKMHDIEVTPRHRAVFWRLAGEFRSRAVPPILAPAAPKKSRARGKKEKLGGKGVR